MKNSMSLICTKFLIAIFMIAGPTFGSDDHEHDSTDQHAHGHDHDGHDEDRGPKGGRLLEDGDFTIELTVYELGIPPEFRIYGYLKEDPIQPEAMTVNVVLNRLGNVQESYEFVPENDYLRSLKHVGEPHSFDVTVTAEHRGKNYRWEYENHEGRTTIPTRVATAAGIAVEPAGPATIRQRLPLTGTVQTNPANISEVQARFPGLVRRTLADVGTVVTRGQRLAEIESNESLRSFFVASPIDGLIVDRNIQAGQATGEKPLFVIANLKEIWVQLDVFGKDLPLVAPGQAVTVSTLEGAETIGTIDWISPLVSHGSQSVRARVVVQNQDQQFRPGEFVRAEVVVAEFDVPLAVKRTGLQRFRDFDVVFGRVDDTYEVRMLELGRQDSVYVEVHGGIQSGAAYVTENSYLIKADIEKSGASHDH